MDRVIKLAALASLGAMLTGCPKNEAEAEPEAGSVKQEAAEPASAEATGQAAEEKEEEGAAEEKKEDSGDGW